MDEDIKDSRVFSRVRAGEAIDARTALGQVDKQANVVGRLANILLEPETATSEFEAKLGRLSLVDLRRRYPRFVEDAGGTETESRSRAIARIIDQAVGSINEWYSYSYEASMPMYAGPSGHTLGYLNLYAKKFQEDEFIATANPSASLEAQGIRKPSLAEARLVMLASLIGNKEHHTYSEVMFASHGIEVVDRKGRKEALKFQYRLSYRDLLDDPVAGDLVKAAFEKVVGEARIDPELAAFVDDWSSRVRGSSGPGRSNEFAVHSRMSI